MSSYAHIHHSGCCHDQVKLSIKKGDMAKAAMSHFHMAGAHSNLGETDKAIKSYKVCAHNMEESMESKENDFLHVTN